jgi:hypothetical protein
MSLGPHVNGPTKEGNCVLMGCSLITAPHIALNIGCTSFAITTRELVCRKLFQQSTPHPSLLPPPLSGEQTFSQEDSHVLP